MKQGKETNNLENQLMCTGAMTQNVDWSHPLSTPQLVLIQRYTAHKDPKSSPVTRFMIGLFVAKFF